MATLRGATPGLGALDVLVGEWAVRGGNARGGDPGGGRSIAGRWEIAPDRTTFDHDFDLHYTRVS